MNESRKIEAYIQNICWEVIISIRIATLTKTKGEKSFRPCVFKKKKVKTYTNIGGILIKISCKL